MDVTDKMLTAAVKKAVEVGLLPKSGFIDVIEENWQKVKAVLEAALAAADEAGEIGRLRAMIEDAERERDALIRAWPQLGLFSAWQYRGAWAARSKAGEVRTGFPSQEAAVRFSAGLDAAPGEGGDQP